MAVITISREVGAGGTWLALKLAEHLGATCVDKEIIHEIARRMGKTHDEMQDFDQDTYSRLSVFFQEALASIAKGGRVFHSFGLGPLDWDGIDMFRPYPVQDFAQDEYVDVLRQTLTDLATRHPHVVVLGRGGQMVFRDHTCALHLRVVADHECRVTRLVEEQGIDRGKAEQLMAGRDESGRRFLADFFDAEWDDPHLYHLVLNTSRLTPDEALALVLDLAARRGIVPAPPPAAAEGPAPTPGASSPSTPPPTTEAPVDG